MALRACVGTIDRDYVNIAPGLRAVTGIQEPTESRKERKHKSPYGRRLLMSDIVTFTEKDFYPAVHTAFEYILTTGRLKTDCRTDTDFDKKWHLEPVSRHEKNLGFFNTVGQILRTHTLCPTVSMRTTLDFSSLKNE